MVRVMATGVFDLLHPGHVYYLEKSAELGNELFVVVARDSVAERMKYRPINSEEHRLMMVKALKPVTEAILGYDKDIYKILDDIKPDIIALGYDQFPNTHNIEEEILKRNMKTKIVRIKPYSDDDEIKATRKIIDKIVKWNAYRETIKK